MARRPAGNGDEIFRVIIKRHYGTEVLGPYGTLSAAKGCLTTATDPARWEDSTGHIERAVTVWDEVAL